MMKTTSIALVSVLALLAGCSTSSPEIPSGPAQSAVAAPNAPGAAKTDVFAQQIFARPALSVPARLVQLSQPMDPGDVIGKGYEVEPTVHTDGLKLVPKGIVAPIAVPIDSIDDEAYMFITPQIAGEQALEDALRNVIVLDPAGNQVNVRATKGQGGQPMADVAMSAIPLAGHPVGVYTVKFKGPTTVGYAIETRQNHSAITMTLKPSTGEHLLGNQGFVDVMLAEAGRPITGAHVTASLISGEHLGAVTGMPFSEVGNGVYRAPLHTLLTANHDVGAYLADISVEGVAPSGVAFQRHGRTGFHYGIPTAHVLDVTAQRAITGPDGKIAAFEFDVAIESASLDRLEISGKLTAIGADGLEHPVAIAHVGQAFDAGRHLVTLRFDAGHVRMTGLDGDLHLRDVQMFSLGTNTLFHRESLGRGRVFASIQRAQLEPISLDKLTAGQQMLVQRGVYKLD